MLWKKRRLTGKKEFLNRTKINRVAKINFGTMHLVSILNDCFKRRWSSAISKEFPVPGDQSASYVSVRENALERTHFCLQVTGRHLKQTINRRVNVKWRCLLRKWSWHWRTPKSGDLRSNVMKSFFRIFPVELLRISKVVRIVEILGRDWSDPTGSLWGVEHSWSGIRWHQCAARNCGWQIKRLYWVSI